MLHFAQLNRSITPKGEKMNTGLSHTVNCGRHVNKIDEILRRIETATGLHFCRRQDGNCHPGEPAVAVGTCFLQFFNIPVDRYDDFVKKAEAVKTEVLANVA
ncbi:hypothetical protein GYA27_01745 [candidate division WWE3 bacterium]|uniref:Uncharacterized protein n=1 Tax=candidate division WWE3 bacterium TaxID=2053526 RepID=A0A7X9HGH5_UNCKA|nr:hypothetical protein [candidate division WWE3 bacterium]